MPEVEISPENQRVLEGSDARFYCTATGYPAPVVKWTRGKRYISLFFNSELLK